MKKILCLCLSLLMVLQFCACGNTAQPEQTTTKSYNSVKEDSVLNVLMTAASFSYYFCDELYEMLAAVGVEARICNVYKNGAGIKGLHDFWKNGDSDFQLIIHDKDGKTVMENVSFDQCLSFENWDLISVQDGSSSFRTAPAQTTLEKNRPYLTYLVDEIRKRVPNAEFYMQHIWAYDIGFNRDGFQMTSKEQQQGMADRIREYTLAACEEHKLLRVPSGQAWIIARQSPEVGIMCSRLAVNNGEGDYYHDGDIGGGQYLNACVWFETLTGQSCIGNPFRPVYKHNGIEYTLSEDLISVLQNAAHQAVENMRAGN